MARDNPNFSKILRNLRDSAKKANGTKPKKFNEYIESALLLISNNLYTASGAPETIDFLCDLISAGEIEKAKHAIDFMLDIHLKQLARNPKLGKLIGKLVENNQFDYAISFINRFLLGKVSGGPSVASHAQEIASNGSLISIVKALAKNGHEEVAGLMLHQIAAIDPKELARNKHLDECIATLQIHGQDSTAEMVASLTQPFVAKSKRQDSRFR